MLRVDPAALTESTSALREVSDVSRSLDGARVELAAQLERAGCEFVHRSTESFLDAWAVGLRGAADRADRLGNRLHTAASAYQEAEHRLRGAAAGGADGGPA